MAKLSREGSQNDRMLALLLDFHPHRTDEIKQKVYGSKYLGSVRISARIYDLRKRGYKIPNALKDHEIKTLYWYQLLALPKRRTRFKKKL